MVMALLLDLANIAGGLLLAALGLLAVVVGVEGLFTPDS
jgi:hypothetical protein